MKTPRVFFLKKCLAKKGTDHSVPNPHTCNYRKSFIRDRAVCPLFRDT